MTKYDRALSSGAENTNLYAAENDRFRRLAKIKGCLNALTIGHITAMHDLVIYCSDANEYIVGETINYSNSPRIGIDEAAARIGIAAGVPVAMAD